jgi:ABC-type phosphate transport system permease subunit
LAFAGVYFFFTLIRGGYEFITAGGDKDAIQSARKRIFNSLIGVSIIFGVFAFVFLVETLFGLPIRNFSIPNV